MGWSVSCICFLRVPIGRLLLSIDPFWVCLLLLLVGAEGQGVQEGGTKHAHQGRPHWGCNDDSEHHQCENSGSIAPVLGWSTLGGYVHRYSTEGSLNSCLGDPGHAGKDNVSPWRPPGKRHKCHDSQSCCETAHNQYQSLACAQHNKRDCDTHAPMKRVLYIHSRTSL